MSTTDSFKEKLDSQYQWPSLYTFKFIAPLEKVAEVKAFFTNHEVIEKPSSKGNYISLTINMMARSSNEVTDIYIKVHDLGGGIISL